MGVNATGLFWRWHFIVRVRGDSSIMEIQRGSSDSINCNMIIVVFPVSSLTAAHMSLVGLLVLGLICLTFNTACSHESVLTPEFSLDVWCDVLGVTRCYRNCNRTHIISDGQLVN